MFLLGIGDIFSDFLSELEITFDFDSVNFEMNSEDALKKGGRLKNSNPNEVQEFAAPFLTKALKTLWQSAKSLLAPSDLNKFKFLLKQALPILKNGSKQEIDSILSQLEVYIVKCIESYHFETNKFENMSYDDSHIDAVLVIAMLYFMSVRTKEASSFHKDFGVYFKSELQLKDNNKLEPPKPPKLKFPNNYLW